MQFTCLHSGSRIERRRKVSSLINSSSVQSTMTTPPNKPVIVNIMDLEVSELFGNPTHHPSWVFPSSKKKKDDKIKDGKIKDDKTVAKKPPNAKCCSWPPYMVVKMPDGRIRSVNRPDPPKIKASANWGTSVPPKGWGSKALPADT